MDTYVLGALIALAGGLVIRRTDPRREEDDGERPPSPALRLGGWEVPLAPLALLLVLVEGVIFANKVTFASYIDTPQSFLLFMVPALIVGMVAEVQSRSITYQPRRFLLLFCVVTLGAAYMAPSVAPLGPDIAATSIGVLFALGFLAGLYFAFDSKLKFGKVFTAAAAVALLLPTVAGFATAPYPYQNPLYVDLDGSQTTDAPEHWITDSSEIRVISWELATQYLHRAYGQAAAYLDTQDSTLLHYTDPSVVHGRFAWVNVPVFEFIKWFDDRDHPQFVYIDNIPANMSREEPNVIHEVDQTIDYHMQRIDWGKRINNIIFERYSDYVLVQSRVDVDESNHLFFVLYLGRVPTGFAMPNLERLVIIDPTTGDAQDFAVDDPSIPSWLEVIYPDRYVYEWVEFWAHSRFGWTYTWTNKQHLYQPDDSSARLLVINGTAFWQVPLRQQDSHVLGGYVTVNTRTGDAVFYNREVRSMADMDTAMTQVSRYLTSGELGFQHLDLHEGYLYPFLMAGGQVREAYVFPLYAGYSIAKYAILDAEEYTSPPMIAEALDAAVAQYSARVYGAGGVTNGTLVWQNVTLQNGYVGKDPSSSQEEAVITFGNKTFVITSQELRGGNVADAEDEWRELNLAVAEFERTGTAALWVTVAGSSVLDVDFEGADLVVHV